MQIGQLSQQKRVELRRVSILNRQFKSYFIATMIDNDFRSDPILAKGNYRKFDCFVLDFEDFVLLLDFNCHYNSGLVNLSAAKQACQLRI